MRALALTLAALTGLAAGMWGAVGWLYAARPAPHPAPASPVVMLAARLSPPARATCRQYWRISQDGGRYQVRDDYFFPSVPVCVRADGDPGFTVSRSAADSAGPETVAFPNVFSGCESGACTRGRLPERVSDLGGLTVTDDTRATAAGRWADGIDEWVTAGRRGRTVAEVMVWDRTAGFGVAGQSVTIGGIRYRLNWWRTRRVIGGRRVSWPLLIFTRARPASGVSIRPGLLLGYVRHMGLITGGAWLQNAEAGFEIWAGGRGLSVRHFAVWTPRMPARHLPACPHRTHCPRGEPS